MWILTSFGFFSVVRKPGDTAAKRVTIRARARRDLERLRELYLPALGEISEGAGTDYEFRATAPEAEWAEAVRRAALDIDYDNFKNAVGKRQDEKRAAIYHGVWGKLKRIKESVRDSEAAEPQ